MTICTARARLGRLTLAVLLTGTIDLNAALARDYPYGNSRRSENHTEPPPPGGYVTIEGLLKLITDEKLTSIEGVLERLPAELRNRYVLMYKSRSLQRATFAKPRVILFTGNAGFMLAFGSGDPELSGGDRIETIQFREGENRWEMREIAFRPGRPPVVSPVNPRKCLECHQSPARRDVDPRPNWEPYNLWPGAYASADGRLTSVFGFSSKDKKFGPDDAALFADQKQEGERLKQFDRFVKPNHPRYRTLGPFVENQTSAFTDLVVGSNDLRVARLAARTPDWDVYRPAFLDVFLCGAEHWATGSYQDVPSGAGKLVSTRWPQELRDFHAPLAAKIVRLEAVDYLPNVSQFVRVLFDSRGLDTSDWSTDFKSGGRLAFNDRFGTPSSPMDQFRNGIKEVYGLTETKGCDEAIGALDPGVGTASAWKANGRLERLVQDSRAHAAAPDRTVSRAALQAQCASCHVGAATDAPWIPFDDDLALKTALQKPGYPNGTLLDEIAHRLRDFAPSEEQMPPTGGTLPAERRRLVEYLQAL